MVELFKAHLDKFVSITDAEFSDIISFFDVRTVRKKENLLEEGQICKEHFFVLKGILRKFYINEKGSEQTTEFAIENWWMTDNMAYEHQSQTDFYIQAVEKTELLVITQKNQELLLSQFPQLERYFRFVYQRAYAATQIRIKYIFSLAKDEFYFQLFKKNIPNLFSVFRNILSLRFWVLLPNI